MWKKISAFIFKNEDDSKKEENIVDLVPDQINRALAHYCIFCDQGFKTVGAAKNHKRIKHGKQSTA